MIKCAIIKFSEGNGVEGGGECNDEKVLGRKFFFFFWWLGGSEVE